MEKNIVKCVEKKKINENKRSIVRANIVRKKRKKKKSGRIRKRLPFYGKDRNMIRDH